MPNTIHDASQYADNRDEFSRRDRHLLSAISYRTLRNIGFDELNKVSGLVRVN
jgi:hypothetical protein